MFIKTEDNVFLNLDRVDKIYAAQRMTGKYKLIACYNSKESCNETLVSATNLDMLEQYQSILEEGIAKGASLIDFSETGEE